MKMKKIFALTLAFAMTVALCACGGEPTPSNTGETNSPDAGPGGDGKVYELTVSMHDAETAGSSQFLKAWGDEIEEASGGRIKFSWFFGGSIANAMESMDACSNGVADVVWSAPALFSGRVHTTMVASLPLAGLPNNGDGGEIIWNMYEKYDYISDEWDGFKVLAIHPNGGASMLTTKVKVDSLAAFENLRVRTTTSSLVAFLTDLGGAPTSFSATDTFENLEKNVADGTIADWNFITGFRLYDICKYATTDTINTALGCSLMNENSYAKLPADLQAIIDEHSGLYASRMGGEFIGSLDETKIQECEDAGLELYAFPDSMSEDLERAAEVGRQAWFEEIAEFGYDGEEIYNDFLAEMEALGY